MRRPQFLSRKLMIYQAHGRAAGTPLAVSLGVETIGRVSSPADQLTHTRRNGNFTLDIVAHPRFGLPFGQDRLIPVWVATLAVLQKSRMVRFASPSQMLDYFDLPKNGYHYNRIVQGFQRVFGATIFFGTEEQRQKTVVSNSARFHFFEVLPHLRCRLDRFDMLSA